MQGIVCVDQAWGIGNKGELLFRISQDLKRFRTLTMGHVLLMGRKTFASLPGLLPGRVHVVVTRQKKFYPQGVVVSHSPEAGVAAAESIARERKCGVFLIGGAELYGSLARRCDTFFVTKIHAKKSADAFFLNLDRSQEWACVSCEEKNEEDLSFSFCEYRKL